MTRTGKHQRCIFAMRRLKTSGALALGAMFVSAVIGTPSAQAQTYTYKVLHSFTGGADGGIPTAGLIGDSAGNLYGTTAFGGLAGDGVVFKLDKTGETVLHGFTGVDGYQPMAGLIRDSAGNLYGTTYDGGNSAQGEVFKLDTAGTETVLYSFTGGADGGGPVAGLTRDSAGNLYGTTEYGGSGVGGSGYGVVFRLNTTGETVLHTFTGGVDGGHPFSGLLRDSTGNLYGTAYNGGSGGGVVFKLDTAGTETVLHSFIFAGPAGGEPEAGLIGDSAGNLYGTASGGGASNRGVVFKLDKTGETVLYSFKGGTDGDAPRAGVIRDSAGNLYGTTFSGGASSAGVVFKVDTTGTETVLHTFTGGADGGYPSARLIRDAAGNLYGTASQGGASNQGVVFKLTPAAISPVTVFSDLQGTSTPSGLVIGQYSPGFNFVLGASFVPSTQNYTLDQVQVLLSFSSGVNELILSLYSDSGGIPGSLLESWDLVNALTPVPSIVTVNSLLHPNLLAGQRYWVTAGMAGSTSSGVWWVNPLGEQGIATNSINGGPFAPPFSTGSGFHAFAVLGSVPIP